MKFRFRSLVASLAVAAALSVGGPRVGAQSPTLPLVQPSDLTYLGAFTVPPGFDYGGTSLTFNPANNSLFMIGWNNTYASAEINIPPIAGVATFRQTLIDPLEGQRGNIGVSDNRIGGQLLYGGRLLVSVYAYYDANYAQTRTHFSRPINLSATGQVIGPVQTSTAHNAGYYASYMAHVPSQWQSAFGAPAVTGGCCIPILSRTSYGPALFAFEPATMQTTADLLWYDGTHPLEQYGAQGSHPLFNGSTNITGVVIPDGTGSVLFFGRTGIGNYCYGDGVECNDPANAAKGEHAYPYRGYVWAYSAADLVAVKNGSMQPWAVRPYAAWALPQLLGDNVGVGGAAYDPATKRLYISQTAANGPDPIIHVFRVEPGTTQTDTTPPSVSLTSPGSGAQVSGTIALQASASDNVGVAGVWFTVDGQTVGSEDTVAPFAISWNSQSVSGGSHVVQAVARDGAGNTSTASASISVSGGSTDTTAPAVTLTSPSNGAVVSGLVPLTASATDNVGIASVQFWINGSLAGTVTTAPYSVGWNTAVAANGAHTIHAVARDAAGNATSSQTVGVSVNNTSADTIRPTVAVTSPASGATVTGTVALSATASDNIGVAGVRFLVDGVQIGAEDLSAPYQGSWVTTGANNGSRLVEAEARDAAGNVSKTGVTVSVNNTPQDTTPPTVAVTSPTTGATISGTVSVTASATDNIGIAGVRFTLDGVNIGVEDTSAPYSLSWNTAGATNGSHVLRAIARDMAGTTTSSGPISVTVNNTTSDTTAPTVSLSAPASGAVVSNSVVISASASDNVGVVSVQFTVDGVDVGVADTSAPYSSAWISNSVANGYHTLRAVARDAAGNSRTSSGRSVYVSNSTVDTSAPSVAVSAPGSGATVAGTVTITAAAADNVGIVGVQFSVDGVAVGLEDTAAPFERPWSTTTALNRNYVVTATARDAAGNRTTSAGVTVKVKNTGKGKPTDVNDDGLADLLFSHDTGKLYAWYMDGSQLIGESLITPDTVNPVWQVASNEDFNGDRKSDFLWQHSITGQVYLWFMDRATLVGEVSLLDSTAWRVAATGDLNGDGQTDIVWRHPTGGQVRATLMQGTATIADVSLTPGVVDSSWRVAGASDLNHDGKADLVWQNSATGALAYWCMDGTTTLYSGALDPVAVNVTWQIRAVEDFDEDGNADLVFQHASSGQLYIWYLEGTTLARHGYLTPGQVGPGWRIVGGK